MDVENHPIFKETNLGETHFSASTIMGGKICSNNLPIKHYQKMTQQVNIDSTWNISSCSTELGKQNLPTNGSRDQPCKSVSYM